MMVLQFIALCVFLNLAGWIFCIICRWPASAAEQLGTVIGKLVPRHTRRLLVLFRRGRALDEPRREPSVVREPQPGVPCLSGPQSLNIGSSSS